MRFLTVDKFPTIFHNYFDTLFKLKSVFSNKFQCWRNHFPSSELCKCGGTRWCSAEVKSPLSPILAQLKWTGKPSASQSRIAKYQCSVLLMLLCLEGVKTPGVQSQNLMGGLSHWDLKIAALANEEWLRIIKAWMWEWCEWQTGLGRREYCEDKEAKVWEY